MEDATQANPQVEADRSLLRDAQSAGLGPSLRAYARLSGPGWLQSAITLGGGSLSGALYLGVLGGYSLLWLQLLAIVMGVIMLSAISYVALSTNEKPFHAINRHINPVLGWGWAAATLMANMVWCLPQFSLGTAALQQNLLPGLVGPSGLLGNTGGKILSCAALLAVAVAIIWQYDAKGKGIRIFETVLKIMVAVIVISFFGVVVKLSFTGSVKWTGILGGFVPDFSLWSRPADTFAPYLAAIDSGFRDFWSTRIVGMQRDVMIAAAATAVGINMTFLLPYSMLNKGWGKEFRGFAAFDLFTGMAIPYLLVTTCVVIASATQFHTKPGLGLLDPGVQANAGLERQFDNLLAQRVKATPGSGTLTPGGMQTAKAGLPEADRLMAAMLVKRDAFNLAESLKPLTGRGVARYVFGLGVLGMALSTIIILMLISGFVVCEVFGFPHGGKAHKWGCMLSAVGVLGPFIWSKTAFWLAIPTSMFGMTLLPIAYLTFFLMMNSRSLMGDQLVRGNLKILWNFLMFVATALATIAAGSSIWANATKSGTPGVVGKTGFVIILIYIALGAVVYFVRKTKARPAN